MNRIGFFGGGLVHGLGNAARVKAFFECARVCAGRVQHAHLILDRLYRRYVDREDHDTARIAMSQVKSAFASMDVAELSGIVDVDQMDPRPPDAGNLADVFVDFFVAFRDCLEMIELGIRDFGSMPNYNYAPLRVDISNGDALKFLDRPLQEYDQLRGEPDWSDVPKASSS